MSFDIQLPTITDASLKDEKQRKAILEALYQTNEQLRYVLNNIGMENLSEELQVKIESESADDSELEWRVGDVERGIAQLRMLADSIVLRVTDNENNISELILMNDQIALRIKSAENNIAQLDMTSEQITARVESVENEVAYLSVASDEIVARVEDAENGLAQVEVAAGELAIEVHGKVDGDKVISSINATPEEIKINGEKISLEGQVTANETFKIHEDGSMEATGGTIGGWTINENSLGAYGSSISIQTDPLTGEKYGEINATAIAGTNVAADRLFSDVLEVLEAVKSPLFVTSGTIEKNENSDEYHIVDYESTAYMDAAGLKALSVYASSFYSRNSALFPNEEIVFYNPINIAHDGDAGNQIRYSLTTGGLIKCFGLDQISDARLKKNIADIPDADAAQLILSLRPVSYTFKDGDAQERMGFIAQEAPDVLRRECSDGYLGLDYIAVIAPLVKLVQRQEARISALENKIKMMEVE